MKKHFSFCSILVCLFMVSTAQKSPIECGFQTGLNLNSSQVFPKNGDDFLTGASIGAHVKINMRKQLNLKVLLSYDQEGWVWHSTTFVSQNATGIGDVMLKLKYLNLPVLAEYSFGKKVKYHLDGGCFVGLLLSNHYRRTMHQSQPPNQINDVDTKVNYLSSINFGVAAGLGMQIPLSSKLKLDIDVRDYRGLTEVQKKDIKTNCLALLCGLSFRLN